VTDNKSSKPPPNNSWKVWPAPSRRSRKSTIREILDEYGSYIERDLGGRMLRYYNGRY